MTVKSTALSPNSSEIAVEAQSTSPINNKAARPKPVSQWTVADVQKWFRRHCGDYYHLYSIKFLEQDITGRSLVRLTDNSLLRLEIVIPEHRQAILRQIAKLRLRSNILLLRDVELEMKQNEQTNNITTEVH